MPNELRIRLAPMAPDDDSINIYVTPEDGEALKADLEANGYETSWALEHAFGVNDLIIAVMAVGTAIGGLNGLAAVLNAFFYKNQHRSITLRSGDNEITLTGMPEAQMQPVIKAYLDQVGEQQKSLDESWHRILEETDDPGSVE